MPYKSIEEKLASNKKSEARCKQDPECRERRLEYRREYQKRYRTIGTVDGIEIPARSTLTRRGITTEQYIELWKTQDGQCAICHIDLTLTKGHGGKGHIDHDHSTGKVRGLLCSKCNQAIGLLNEDTDSLRNAISYLTTRNAA